MAAGVSDALACFKPVFMRQLREGPPRYVGRPVLPWSTDIPVPCGQCIGCRLERSRQWAVRCVHEAQLHEHSSFITLTYRDDDLPHDESLDLRHWQLFAKRLRKQMGPFRFFHCGEYGDKTLRPHYHAAIFGLDFHADRKVYRQGDGYTLWNSPTLTSVWGKGHAVIGNLTFESAAYVARYIMKKRTGDLAPDHYGDRKPEYTTMSRRKGLGELWFDRYHTDIYPNDFVVLNGRKMLPPKYYDRLLAAQYPELWDRVQAARLIKIQENVANNTPERLHVRETVAQAQLEQQIRDAD